MHNCVCEKLRKLQSKRIADSSHGSNATLGMFLLGLKRRDSFVKTILYHLKEEDLV